MTEFSTSALLEVEVSDSSLRSARNTIESSIGTTDVGVSASDQLTQSSSGVTNTLTDGGGVASELLSLAEERNEFLEEIEDKVGGRSAAGFPGGGAVGGIGGLAIQGAKITASALIASAATVTAGALIAGGVTLVASDVINSPADINPDNLIAGGASITAGALIASRATVTNSALIARAASIAPGALVAAAATIPPAALIAGAATISAGILIQNRADITAGALIAGTAIITAGVLVGSAATVTAGTLVASAAVIKASDLIANRLFEVPEGPEEPAEAQSQTVANWPSTITVDGQEVTTTGENIPDNLTSGGSGGLSREEMIALSTGGTASTDTTRGNRAQEAQRQGRPAQVNIDVTANPNIDIPQSRWDELSREVKRQVLREIDREVTGPRGR